LQDNGDIYLTYGYYDALEIDDPYSDDSSIRWVFKLKQEAELDSELSAISSMATAWEWFDCLHGDEMVWDGRREINLDEFPGVTFRWLPERVDAVTDTEIIRSYTGMPVWSVFLRDLTAMESLNCAPHSASAQELLIIASLFMTMRQAQAMNCQTA
jgi:hypothetical protein